MKKIMEFWSYTDTVVVYLKLVVDPLHFTGLLFLVTGADPRWSRGGQLPPPGF